MTEVEKRQIAEQLRQFSERVGSQNKTARMLDGVSTATVSKILTGKWETIGDEMWRGIAAKIGGTTDEWHIVTTEAFLRMQFIMQSGDGCDWFRRWRQVGSHQALCDNDQERVSPDVQ